MANYAIERSKHMFVKEPIEDIPASTQSTVVSTEMLKNFDIAGPRYTSYPTADRFVEAFNDEAYQLALEQRKLNRSASALSLYVHIPFCESLCFFCACNKIVTKHHERATEYLKYLKHEIDLHVARLGSGQNITQLHLGGGSPTFFSDVELTELMTMLRHHFKLPHEGEFSIEIDPRTVNESRLKYLATLGFNRLSFGVQDFDEEVQKAVHRVQPVEQVFDLMKVARRLKFQSVNVDLIYGLPKQTPETFKRTIAQLIKLRPDRVALYAYAHLPERFKPQRRISIYELPTASVKVELLSSAISSLLEAGYVYVGMDHFALPDDALAVAKRQGRLHRNFQGYSTQSDCDLIGLGVSAIGKVGNTYSQNAKTLDEYYDLLNQNRFPVVRGLALTRDDMLRRTVIMALMCQGGFQYEDIEQNYLIDFKDYFSEAYDGLKKLVNLGFLEMDKHGMQVTNQGWFFVRAIAMLFDRYLQADQNRTRFSKII
jgi:oxygen-independent coproporphyrinogen III oxidase